MLGRATHQLRRAPRRRERVPARAVEPGRDVRRRAHRSRSATCSTTTSTPRRASASPTTCSATAAPRSRRTTAASTTSSDRSSPRRSNLNTLAEHSRAVDRSRTTICASTRASSPRRTSRRSFRRFDPDAERPYSDEINVGIDHQLVPNFAVGVSYHRRQHRDGLGIVDLARPSSRYTPVERTYTDPDTQDAEDDHGLQPRPRAGVGARSRHHQRGRARKRLRRREVHVQQAACRTAGSCSAG